MNEPLPEHAWRRLLAIAAEADVPAATLHVPEIPARYRVEREVGRGGMGVVYEAFDTWLGRRCAVKVLGPAAGASEEARIRFAREALAAARLRHPNIAAIYDAAPGHISMQLVSGTPISALPSRDPRHLVSLVRDAARAVHHAHEAGIVHRDLKPSNLLVEGDTVFVVDFGLAKDCHPDAAGTHSGSVVGTPAYMAPEQARGRGEIVDARSDVYALGATLHHVLTGAPPFEAREIPELLRSVVEDDAPAAGVDRDLDLVLLKCLAKEPTERYASAAELADDLERWLADEPVRARAPTLLHRVRKLVRRRRTLLRVAGLAALGAGIVTALALLPIALRESAARNAADEAVAFSGRAASAMQDAAVFHRLGDLPSAHRGLDACIAEARAFLARHEVPRIRHLLSRLLRARGKPEEALAELELAIATDPAFAEARFERGVLLASDPSPSPERRARAVADLSTPVVAGSVLTSLDVLAGHAELHRLEGRHELAKDMLEEVLVHDPTNLAARSSLALTALALGDGNLARYYSASAMDLQQGYGPTYLAREGRTLPTRILGLQAALVDFAPELTDSPDHAIALAHRGLVHLRRALRLEREGDRAEALAAVRAAIEDHDATLSIHPEIAGAWNNRAACLAEADRMLAASGDTAGAVEARLRARADLQRATTLAPTAPEAHFNAGSLALRSAEIARRLGRIEAARAELVRARASLGVALASAPGEWPHLRGCRARVAEAEAALRDG